MPFAEWYLKIKETDQDWTKVLVDPAMIAGLKGIFGQALFLPYTVSEKENGRVTLRLLTLEGWIGWSGETDFVARLLIPSQVVRSDGRQLELRVPITDAQVEAIEEARKGSQVILTVSLGGLSIVTPRASSSIEVPPQPGLMTVQSSMTGSLVIERERWLTVLQQLGAGTRRLVELPEPRLPREVQDWAECMRLLDGATQFHRSGEHEHVLINCRSVIEGIPRVLCAVWGLTLQGRNFRDRAQSLRDQLSAAWPGDRRTPETLQSLLTGAWHWLAPTPHYGTDIPQREEAAFALGLCTDLLQFAGQVLQAHPGPIAGVS